MKGRLATTHEPGKQKVEQAWSYKPHIRTSTLNETPNPPVVGIRRAWETPQDSAKLKRLDQQLEKHFPPRNPMKNSYKELVKHQRDG